MSRILIKTTEGRKKFRYDVFEKESRMYLVFDHDTIEKNIETFGISNDFTEKNSKISILEQKYGIFTQKLDGENAQILITPETIYENIEPDLRNDLKPIFDMIGGTSKVHDLESLFKYLNERNHEK